jgi:hypothetical protein
VRASFARTLSITCRSPSLGGQFPGGGHSGALWQAQASAWLAMARTYLATGQTVLHRT